MVSMLKSAVIWAVLLAFAAFLRVHFRNITTSVAYQLGQLKNQETRLLEERSRLRGDLARLTTKKSLDDILARKTEEE